MKLRVHENPSNDTKYIIRGLSVVWWRKHLERERRRISGAARDGSKSKCELAGKMREEKEEREREKGEGRKVAQKLERSVLGSSTRQLGHRKTRYASIFIFGSLPKFRPGRSHLSKLSSVCDNISSLLPSPYLFLSFLPLSLYRPPHKKFLEYRLKFGYLLTSIYTRDKCKQFYVQWKSIQSLFMIFR